MVKANDWHYFFTIIFQISETSIDNFRLNIIGLSRLPGHVALQPLELRNKKN